MRAEEEAAVLAAHTAGDGAALDAAAARRERGEPLARIVGWTEVCGVRVVVRAGVYVPRWTTQVIARAAAERLPPTGTAVDLCTGSGAVAAVLRAAHPLAEVLATDLDPDAVACARENDVDAVAGDLFDPLPPSRHGTLDVVVAVPPFVPAEEMPRLARDVRENERQVALDGGERGLAVARRIVEEAPSWLVHGGSLVLEVGPDQVPELVERCEAAGFGDTEVLVDDDGDPCGVAARRA